MKENYDHIINDDLLVKYLLGETSSEENLMIEQWIKSDPANTRYFEHFRLIWEEAGNLSSGNISNEEAAWTRFKTRISQPPARSFIFPQWTKIAAAFIVVAGASLLTYILFIKQNPVQNLMVRTTDQTLNDTLPDGSIVTLNKNSRLSYPNRFEGNERPVNLTGEAFFNVAPDKSKPFLIHVNDVTIKVVGTSFNVRSENGKTEIIVETGIVQVIRKNRTVELRPKEKMLVSPDSMTAKEAVQDRLYNYYRTREFVCDNTPLWKLVEVLNEAYSVRIVIERNELRNLPLTTTFSNESLEHILEIIRETFDIEIVQSGNKIVLR